MPRSGAVQTWYNRGEALRREGIRRELVEYRLVSHHLITMTSSL
jgi:hypothetical protein